MTNANDTASTREPVGVDVLSSELVARAGDAIIIANGAGEILFWNAGAERIFDYPSAQAVGRPLEIIIPENLRARHQQGYAETMRTGKTRYGEQLLAVPAIKRGGERISIEFTVTLLGQDETGRPAAIAAIIRDVTQRWNEQRALRERLRDLEAATPPAPEG